MRKKMMALLLCCSILISLLGGVTITAGAEETAALDYSQNLGKYATFDVDQIGFFHFAADPAEDVSLVYGAEEIPQGLTVVIVDWYLDSIDGIWYKIEAAPENILPEDIAQNPWVLDGYVGEELFSLIMRDPPVEEEFYAQELTQTSGQGIQVGVSGELPQDTRLSVQDITVDPAEYGITGEETVLAALDVRLLTSDGEAYQPYWDKKETVVTIDAENLSLTNGDVVRIYHNHEGTISVLDPFVVIGGKLSFYADRFSSYIVSEVRSEKWSKELSEDEPHTMVIGEDTVFWADYWRPNNTAVWRVSNNDDVIDYTLTGLYPPTDGSYGASQRWAQWLEIKAKRVGTATVTFILSDGENEEAHEFTINVVAPEGLSIHDNTSVNGCLVPSWSEGSNVDLSRVKYTWTRDDGQAITLEAMNSDGSVNISIDRGGATNQADGTVKTITYTVAAAYPDGTELGTASYEVLYGNEILNPSFEKPVINRDHTTVVNGYPELFWKTTAPGTGDKHAMDVEMGIANSNPYGIGAAAHGNQFVELNAEEFGALYQDMLTTPGAKLKWSFSHAKRHDSIGDYDSMYVIVAATKHAQNIKTFEQIKALQDAALQQAAEQGAVIPENSNANVQGFRFTYKEKETDEEGVYYIWHSVAPKISKDQDQWQEISGIYRVPQGQYLTRLFFASDTNSDAQNSTLGNLIDAASAGEFLSYVVEYYKGDELQTADTETGIDRNAYEMFSLKNLQKYLDIYKYPFEISINGRMYPGTVENLKTGLLLTDYGPKLGETAVSKYDPYNIVLKIVFQDPNIRVTKRVTIDGWEDMTYAEQEALLQAGIRADFKLTNQADSSDTHTASLTITQPSDTGELIAAVSFRTITEADFGKLFDVEETFATPIENYAVQTTIDPVVVGVESEIGHRIKNINITNHYVRNVGNLTIKKDVLDPGDHTPPEDDVFTFTVSGPALTRSSYMVSVCNGADVECPVTDGKLLLELKAGEWAVIKNLSLEQYKVEEAPRKHYVLTKTQGAEGTILKDNTAYAGFTNTYSPVGDVKVYKFVDVGMHQDITVDTEKPFEFALTLGIVPAENKGPFPYTVRNAENDAVISSGNLSLDASSTLSFSLKHNQYICIQNLPITSYTLAEADYTGDGYLAPLYYVGEYQGASCRSAVQKAKADIVRCYNPLKLSNGDLKITKEAVTDDSHANIPPMAFVFTVELTNAPDIGGKSFAVTYSCDPSKGQLSADQKTYDLEGQSFTLPQTVTASWDMDHYSLTLELYDGLSATIRDLPPCGYSVTEQDYSAQKFGTGWKTATTGYLGGLQVDGKNPVSLVECVNRYNVTTGELHITKNVAKSYERDTLPDAVFSFTVDPVGDIVLTGSYTVTVGSQTKEVPAKDNKLTVQIPFTKAELSGLRVNDTVTKTARIQGLPFGSYTITETKNTDYIQSSLVQSAEVIGTPTNVVFTNTYWQHLGEITLKKVVSNTEAKDPVLVRITGEGLEMTIPVVPGTPVTIYDLPLGNAYTVTELVDWNWRYKPGGSTTVVVTLTKEYPEKDVTFTNELVNEKWLSSTDVEKNTFS